MTVKQDELDFTGSRYPRTPGYKRAGASEDAARSMRGSAGKLRKQVLEMLEQFPEGMTTDECATALGLSVLAIRPRFSELFADGRIVGTPVRRLNGSGRSATVWKLVPASGSIVNEQQ